MFTASEKRFLLDDYFVLIRETDRYLEFKSNCSGHCWILFRKINNNPERPITIYHKHSYKNPYYHKHYEAYNIGHAIKSIKSHDAYVLEKKKEKQMKQYRDMKVYELAGYQYKRTPQIRLTGKWLQELGFEIGDAIEVKCECGRLVITRKEVDISIFRENENRIH